MFFTLFANVEYEKYVKAATIPLTKLIGGDPSAGSPTDTL